MFRAILLLLALALIILGWVLSQTTEDVLRSFRVQAPIECEDIFVRQSANTDQCLLSHIQIDMELTESDVRMICADLSRNSEEIHQMNFGDAFGFLNSNGMEEFTSIYFVPTFMTSNGFREFGSELLVLATISICEQEQELNRSSTGVKQLVHTLLNMPQNLSKN